MLIIFITLLFLYFIWLWKGFEMDEKNMSDIIEWYKDGTDLLTRIYLAKGLSDLEKAEYYDKKRVYQKLRGDDELSAKACEECNFYLEKMGWRIRV